MELRILGQIAVYGSRAAIDKVASVARIPSAAIHQAGNLRKAPDKDFWCYASPWYQFTLPSFDSEVRHFITSHADVGKALASNNVHYAFFTLCPVADDDSDSQFACLLERETLRTLESVGLGLQIAPASVMPQAPFWVSSTRSV